VFKVANKELPPLTCPECGQTKGIQKKDTGFIDSIVKRYSDGEIHGIGHPDIYITGKSLYKCLVCGYSECNIKYFMPEKLDEAKAETAQWWKDHPNGCFSSKWWKDHEV
jgi:hypothetical protein